MAKRIETDDRGAEIAVEVGLGTIDKDKIEFKERNACVPIMADGLRLPVKGWVDRTDPEIARLLDNPPERVEFRVETHRQEAIDPTIPIADVDKFQKYRRMVILKPAPVNGSTNGNGNGREIPNEPPAQPGPKANEPPAAPTGPKSGGHLTDTWAFAATLGMAELAFEVLVKAGPDKVQLNPKSVRELADRLLAITDAGQQHVRGAVDRNANSHTRARGALRSALELHVPPVDTFGDPAEMDAWQERVTRAVCLLMKVGIDLLDAQS